MLWWYIWSMHHDSDRQFINTIQELEEYLPLTPEERAWHSQGLTVPLRISKSFLSLIDPNDPNDPIRRQVVPTASENISGNCESCDPQQETSHSATGRLIHRYKSRVAFLVTDVCLMYCRHCFRRRFTGKLQGPATDAEVLEAAQYLAVHPEVHEVLFTGGDLLTLSDGQLGKMIGTFRSLRPDLVIRLCTRAPVAMPQRVTDGLIAMLKSYDTAPFYLMIQINHPRELTADVRAAIARFVDAGIPAMNQTVVLKGVNDDADVLEQLCNDLVANRIKPYYLFQGDLVVGTAHMRVPLKRTLELEQELRRRLSGLAMPVLAVDLPDGGGKVPLTHSYLVAETEPGKWLFETADGQRRIYEDPNT